MPQIERLKREYDEASRLYFMMLTAILGVVAFLFINIDNLAWWKILIAFSGLFGSAFVAALAHKKMRQTNNKIGDA